MRLEKLSLYNFKNYEEGQLSFEGNIHCFVGLNGSGKSNLLDAIHYLSFTRSAVNPADLQNVRIGTQGFQVKGLLVKDRKEEVIVGFQTGQKKMVLVDGQEPFRLSEHIGRFPVVLVAPNDIELIWGGSEGRRKFFDSLISQIDPLYLEQLIVYTHQLKQRNGLLKLFSERGHVDVDMLDAYDQQLIPAGQYIHQVRRAFIDEFLPLFRKDYHFLSGQVMEEVTITYRSTMDEGDWGEALKRQIQRDISLQRTGSGVHRDDFLFTLQGQELRRFGSQGQQKSFLIGLKLAEFRAVSRRKGFRPLLLLDDIFDKLDDERIHKLMLLVAEGTFGQLFITDARASRCREILSETGVKATIYNILAGTLRTSLT